ncbi:hypothetical protein SDC9_194406 [bioreactor metagenome]|uniref:Uncharacterized protein n=1 Tax=bioreactor metagenome TaxID=1076179 RepID=A0A645I657_9ZZZZ
MHGLDQGKSEAFEVGWKDVCRGVPVSLRQIRVVDEAREKNAVAERRFFGILMDNFRAVPVGTGQHQTIFRSQFGRQHFKGADQVQMILPRMFDPGNVEKIGTRFKPASREPASFSFG